ncbi:diacylglycerol acyltransferase-domain-containing protein [Aspergillus pseudodeflectus]|uniref:Diacylglycerol acyltransferase-domain-containing protein n=1 Tax=Aspergillus pseudodeflectus TaxID=176178 RepID=A0ABR4JJ35_9EURO
MATSVLFLANSEHGQTNIVLAIIHELLVRGDINVHLSSFPVLEKRLEKLLRDNEQSYDKTYRSRIHFHPVRGPSNTEIFIRTGKRGAFHPPGYSGSVLGFKSLCEDIWGWTEDEYVDIYESCVEVIQETKPDLVAIDFFFLQGRDAAYNTGHTFVLLNTTSLSHIVLGLQPNAAWAWKYPMPGTGFPYPLPPHLIPLNTMAVMKTAKMYHGSGRRREIRDWRIKHKIHGRFPFADAWMPNRLHLSPALKQLDWPFKVPDNVVACGPILLPVAPVKTQDPEMFTWLNKAPTVLINLGTLYAPNPTVVREIASGVKTFLEATSEKKFQVLWKLPKHPHDQDEIYNQSVTPLQKELESDQVRIRSWFEVEPLAMLETGQVVCSVHHGGANSWYEVIQNGVPHVVLPAWQDCYENAARAEWLGIGVYGNKTRAPDISGKELSKALIKVVGNKSCLEKAAKLQKLCQKKEGRIQAAERLADLATRPDKSMISLPEPKENDPNILKVTNASGVVLETTKSPETKTSSKSIFRRLAEVLAVTFISNTWFVLPVAGYSMLLVPYLRLVALIYIIHIKFFSNAHKTTNRSRSKWFRSSLLWRLHASYFPIKIYRSAPLYPRKKYIFGGHPHGIACHGLIGAFSSDATGFEQLFPGIKNTMLVKDQMFTTPLLREYLFYRGQSGVSRDSCIQHLTHGGYDLRGMGKAITISVGGSREYRIAQPGTMGIVIKIRKGFIRLAVETGAELVPVLVFGENDLFAPIHIESFSIKGLIAWAWEKAVGHKVAFSLGQFDIFCPFRKPLHVVVGRPIEVKQQRFDIQDEYVEELQAKYVDELKAIWANWRDTFEHDASVKFEIVE